MGRLTRLRSGELIALAGAIALIVLSFLPWYHGPDGNLTAWDRFGLTDVLILIAVAAALLLVLANVFERTPALPVVAEVWTAVLGLAAAVAVAVHLLDRPPQASSLAPASWLSLIAAAAVFAGGWRAMRDEHGGLYEPAQPDPRPVPTPPRA
jgi:hypothetical protein